MKEHPEVRLRRPRVAHDFGSDDRSTGYQAHGPRTPHEMGRLWSGLSASRGGLLSQEHLHEIPHFPYPGIRDRCNREPEFVPRDPRDYAQPCV